jgi:hypothetical protein
MPTVGHVKIRSVEFDDFNQQDQDQIVHMVFIPAKCAWHLVIGNGILADRLVSTTFTHNLGGGSEVCFMIRS